MYFDPYVIGFFMGALTTLAVIFLVLLISAIVTVHRRNKK